MMVHSLPYSKGIILSQVKPMSRIDIIEKTTLSERLV